MLFVPDIHINARMKDRIIHELRGLVDRHPEEKSIIFLGDYVYHFAYDRTSLLALFRFFLELYHASKDVYVLAGNHDWISDQFVFEEAKLLTEGMSSLSDRGTLRFLTEPEMIVIEGESVLFFPYNISLTSSTSSSESYSHPLLNAISLNADSLMASDHKNEKLSGHINALLLDYVQSHENLLVVHHYYLEGVVFPGQRGQFRFKDVALDRRWADLPGMRLISGHIHQPFVYRNYCCLGSFWATSPLESNHYKITASFDGSTLTIAPLTLNAYMKLQFEERITSLSLEQEQKQWRSTLLETMQSTEWRTTQFADYVSYAFSDLSLQIIVDRVDYNAVDNYIDADMQRHVRDVQLKKHHAGMEHLMEKMSLADKNLRDGLQDWKDVLKTYLTHKYQEDVEDYYDDLREMQLL